MQRVQEEESHVGYTPPPPYTLVDQQYQGNNNNQHSHNHNQNNSNNNNINPNQQQYHAQNPYPATVIPPDSDFRLAQKLQDEEYAHWVDTNPQQEYYNRSGETSVGSHLPRAPMPPIPEHYQYNHYQSYQNDSYQQLPAQSQQYPIIYASPNQPPLPYTQTSPYASNGASGGVNGQACYGSLNQGGGYYTTQSHPFYNAPYHNYQQISQREEEDGSSCLSGLYDQFFIISVCVIIVFYILKYYYDFDFNFDI